MCMMILTYVIATPVCTLYLSVIKSGHSNKCNSRNNFDVAENINKTAHFKAY